MKSPPVEGSQAPATSPTSPVRIDRARFDAARYPSVLSLPIRFDDLDVNWHVNNVAIIALLQEARVHFNRTLALPALGDGLRTVVAAMNVEYSGEINYPGEVTVSSGIISLGRTSYTFAQRIQQAGASAVYSHITMVVTDATGRPAAIPGDFRSAAERYCLVND